MNTFHLVISTSDGNLFDGDAVSISLRGAEGDLAVMAGHIPLITPVKAGECRLTLADGSSRAGTLDGGLLMTSAEKTVLLSESFQW